MQLFPRFFIQYDSVVILYRQFIADVEIIMDIVIVEIDDAHTPISRRHFERLQHIPVRAAVIVRSAVEDNPVRCIVDVVIPAADALVTGFQKVFMHVDHSHAEIAVHSDDKLG